MSIFNYTTLPVKDDLFLIEAEDLDLETYLVEEWEVASNEKVISLLGSGDAGTASTKFAGPSGLYTVVVGYYDEPDGESRFRLNVNDNVVDNWRADQELDSLGVPTENNFTRRTIGGIELKTGDLLGIEGVRDAQEYARVDFLQLIPSTVDGSPYPPDDELDADPTDGFLIEAEDLDLENYLIEEREVASNEQVISLLGSGDAGTASTKFAGPSGLYTVVVGYHDEIDGESLFRLKVNDNVVDNWRADQELDSLGVPTENNFTRRTIGGIELHTGDVLGIEGFRDAQEYARVDFLQLIPSTVDGSPYPPDDELGKVIVGMNLISTEGIGKEIGTIEAQDTKFGLLLTPDLSGLTPGLHGFHVHENPDCSPGERDGQIVPGLGAGGHYDPENTGRHEGPYGNGHLGDLPPLFVEADGTATLPVLAPRLEVEDLIGRSLMLHQGGDNFSDMPLPLGGGGARIACGVVQDNDFSEYLEIA